MKKTIAGIILSISSLVCAQSEQQSIELPDFVITGKQNISVPIALKKKPDFVSTLSRDFLTPQFAPEELPLLISSEPVPIRPGIKNFNDFISGTVKLQASRYVLPAGELNINQAFGNDLVTARLWGYNIAEYIENAGYNNSGIALANEYFFSTKSEFMPGAKIRLGAGYQRDSYKLFASQTPTSLRETNTGSAILAITNSYNRWVNFGFDLAGNFLAINENGLKESKILSHALFEFKEGSFTAGLKGTFAKPILSQNLSGSSGDDFFSADSYIKLSPISELNLKVGINYAVNSANSFFAPFASAEYKLYKGLTVSGEFNPHVKYFTVADFLKQNLYFNPGLTDNVFEEYKTNITGMIKYEYEKMFTLSLAARYAKVANYFYFDDLLNAGKFDLYIVPETKIFSGGVSFIFYPSRYGHFIGAINYKNVSDQLDRIIPYEPGVTASLAYGYNFDFGLGLTAEYCLAKDVYTNAVTADKLSDYHNFSLSLNFEISMGLKVTADFQNVLNRTNFVWRQYQEKPFDLLLGVEYRW